MVPAPIKVIEYAGYATVTTVVVIGVLFGIGCALNAASVKRMMKFYFVKSDGAWHRILLQRNILTVMNWSVSMLFLWALMNLVNSARYREPLPPLTSMYVLWLTMIYLFAFFGICFIVDEMGFSEQAEEEKEDSKKFKGREELDMFLPDGILSYLIDFLFVEEALRFACACRKLNVLTHESLQLRTQYIVNVAYLHHYTTYDNKSLSSFNAFMSVDPVNMGDGFSDHQLFILGRKCPKLEEINLHRSRSISDDGMQMFLSKMHHLRVVNLSNCDGISDLSVLALTLKPTLTHLNLDHSQYNITDVGLYGFFTACKARLESLSIRDSKMNDRCLVKLAGACPTLKYLDCSECTEGLTHFGISEIMRRCTKLETLILDGCSLVSDHMILDSHEPLLHLRHLSLRQTRISDLLLSRLCKMRPPLTHLDLSSCNITDQGFVELMKVLPSLQVLFISTCPALTDVSIESIAAFSHTCLTHLECVGTNLSVAGLRPLAISCTQLVTLNLAKCSSIYDHDLLVLVPRFTALKLLSISGCPNISQRGAEKLTNECPNLTLFYNHDRFSSCSQHQSQSNLQRVKSSLLRLLLGQGLGMWVTFQAVSINTAS